MAAEPGTEPGSPDGVRELADAVRALASVWSRAPRRVSPRLSPLQLRVLEVTDAGPPLNMTGLAEALCTTSPAASRLCDRLEAAGLLDRLAHPDNRREILLTLTPAGRSLLAEVARRRQRDLDEVLAAMPEERRSDLARGLRSFHEVYAALPPRT
ncbi:MarR family transcriptional regulator [Streptomyces sp. PTM05]|uniref:MarR family transcriptional regulator n=1 Tax=Streptantibioticus parmotrematis TaxID=2873249 RepID=A0ABS7QJV5_9ACTN|nr:MarR family transcriptional regulator [Streptantibioticus parmotrematis]MBY8883464.1 MarR family transcriptional regulator [Streptantibioticus parmotrematis]